MKTGITKTRTLSKTLRATITAGIFVLVNELAQVNNAVCKAIADESGYRADEVKNYFAAVVQQPTREKISAETGTSVENLEKISEKLVSETVINLKDAPKMSPTKMQGIGTAVANYFAKDKKIRLALTKSARVIAKRAGVHSVDFLTLLRGWKKANKNSTADFTETLLAVEKVSAS